MKKSLTFLVLFIIFFGSIYHAQAQGTAVDPEKDLLPENFKVYVLPDGTLINNDADPRAKQSVLPTINAYTDVPGCYLVCYSRNAQEPAYKVGRTIFAIGQVRVAGKYLGKRCLPKGFENVDISSHKHFKELCSKAFPSSCANNNCWTAGDTGSWWT